MKTALDNTREYLESYLSASGFTGDELNAAVEEQMAQAGYTEETLMDSAELNDVLNFLYERATADVTVTVRIADLSVEPARLPALLEQLNGVVGAAFIQ